MNWDSNHFLRSISMRVVSLDAAGVPIPGTEQVWYYPSLIRPSWPTFAGWQHSRGLGPHRQTRR